MERVAFLIEATNQRIDCLLNPESLVIQRLAGVRSRRSATGQLTGPGLANDPLLFTGGGRTQLNLDLLFDVNLSGSSIQTQDVRDLTRPLQQLAQNDPQDQQSRRLPLVRIVWGKNMNLSGYVTALVERLEAFTPDGLPQRSWLRMRFVRADEAPAEAAATSSFPSLAGISLDPRTSATLPVQTITLTGGPAAEEDPPVPGIREAFVQAADIFNTALVNTNTYQAILRFQAQAGALLGRAGELLRGWAEGAGSALAGFVRSAVDGIAARIQALSAPPPSAMVQRIQAIAAQVQAASSAVMDRLRAAANRAERDLAAALGPVFQDMHQMLVALGQSAAIVARAVKAQAVQALHTAYHRIGIMAETIREAVKNLPAEAAGLIRQGVDALGGVLDRIRQTGQMLLFRQIPAALGQVVQGLETLWAAGSSAAIRVIRRAVEGIAWGLKTAYSAAEAAAAVSKRGAVRLAQAGRDQLMAAIEALRQHAEGDQVAAAREGLAQVEGIVIFLQQDSQAPLPEAAASAVAVVRTALDDLKPGAEDAVTAKIQPPLDQLNQALEGLQTEEDQAVAQQVAEALSADEPPAPERPAHAHGVGERLDQVAYSYYGNPAFWRLVALYNDIRDIFHVPAGQPLSIPPVTILEQK